MDQQFHYGTISEAITQLREKGFGADFNFFEGKLKADDTLFGTDELEIADLYRYEGESDPADEAAVFALVTSSGVKGIFVTGYGPSAAEGADELIRHLHYKYSNR